MKKVRTIRIDKDVSDNLDSICNRHGDVSWHIEQALTGYGPIKALSPFKAKHKADEPSWPRVDDKVFEVVWGLYERKGNKKTSKAKYLKLSNDEKLALEAHIPLYVKSTPDKKYRKNLETYINQECWNDEVITNDQNKS